MPDRTSHKSSSLGVVTLAISVIALGAAATPRLLLAQEEAPASVAPGAPNADAVPSADQIDARMAHAEDRINAGASDGSLTGLEAHRVLEELANIKTQSNELASRDGSLTPTDRQFINDRLNTLSRQIRWARNNAADRW